MVESYHRQPSPSEWRKEASPKAPSLAGQAQQEAISQKNRPLGANDGGCAKIIFHLGKKIPMGPPPNLHVFGVFLMVNNLGF